MTIKPQPRTIVQVRIQIPTCAATAWQSSLALVGPASIVHWVPVLRKHLSAVADRASVVTLGW